MSIEYEELAMDLGWKCNGISLGTEPTKFTQIKYTVTVQLPFYLQYFPDTKISGDGKPVANTIPMPARFSPTQDVKIPIVVLYNNYSDLWSLEVQEKDTTMYIKKMNGNGIGIDDTFMLLGSVISWSI